MHEGHRQRLKNRFLTEGIGSFEDHEVLELLLYYAIPQGDTNPLAHRLLEHFGTLSSVFDASVEDLCKVEGVGRHTATLISLMPHISQLYTSLSVRDKKVLANTAEAGEYVCKMIGLRACEVFAIISLDAQRRVISFDIIEEGTVSSANVDARKVVTCALRRNASAIIFAHNHPGGSLCASEGDRRLTQRLCDLFEGMGIHVIDHIIAAGASKFLSMSDNGIMPN